MRAVFFDTRAVARKLGLGLISVAKSRPKDTLQRGEARNVQTDTTERSTTGSAPWKNVVDPNN